MIYTRAINSNTILDRTDLELATLSPSQQQVVLLKRIANLNDEGWSTIVEPVDYMVGFGTAPKVYNIEYHTPRIAVFVNGSEDFLKLTWYRADQEPIMQLVYAPNDSIVYPRVMGDRLEYEGNIINLSSCKTEPKNPCKVFFTDLYGLPQCTILNAGAYNYSYDSDDSYRAYNGELTYQIHKQPSANCTVGDQSVDNALRNFYDGYCASECYAFQNNEDEIKKCAVTEASVTTSTQFNDKLSISSVLTAFSTDIDKLVI